MFTRLFLQRGRAISNQRRRVTEREALAKASNPQALEMNFKGIFLDKGKRILS